MQKFLLLLAGICTFSAGADNAYRYQVDLVNVKEDRIMVKLQTPDLIESEIDFLFPAMVPGTYEVYDFGRFVSNFKASGKNGQIITVKKINNNCYRLSPASALEQISYEVDDTFDKSALPASAFPIVFEPGGSNFETSKNFAFNTHCLFGYFKGHTAADFYLEFKKPEGFYPATGISDIKTGTNADVLHVFDYHDLVDAPILYAKPDTTTLNVAGTKVLVASYSPNKTISSRFIAETLRELLNAQRDYLGGYLPVEKYAFLFYFADKPTLSGSHGALEHSYSSFYVMPEYDSLSLQQQLRDVAAHEFFHIVTPLTIHAKEIGDFDFNDPKMSEHLWLYEGMTEYAAHHAQVKAGIIEMNQFLNIMMQKYENSLVTFNDTMSFTFMSKNVLDKKIHKQYGNVYEKGAVISMCLDVLMRDLSEGQYGTQLLMKDLSRKYGKNVSFEDKDLFNDIQEFSFPEVGDFLRRHVGGHEPLPMADILRRVGIAFEKESTLMEYTLGNPDLSLNEKTNRLIVTSTKDLDAFGKALKLKKRDEFYSLNGTVLRLESLGEVIEKYYEDVREGQEVKLVVYRPTWRKAHYKIKTLAAKARPVPVVKRNQLSLLPDISEKQKVTMRSWLGL